MSSYYQQINNQLFDRALLQKANELQQGQGDGRISVQDAQQLSKMVYDGPGRTDIEDQTVERIYQTANFTQAGRDAFEQANRSAGAKEGWETRRANAAQQGTIVITQAGALSQPAPTQQAGVATQAGAFSQSTPTQQAGIAIQAGPVNQSAPTLQAGVATQAGAVSQSAPTQQAGISIQAGSVSQSAPTEQAGVATQAGSVSQSAPTLQAGVFVDQASEQN